MTSEELVDYYTNLLIIQYRTMPRARATIELISGQIVADQIYQQVRDAFVLETAIGAQLDILAEYVGVQRLIPGFEPAVTYWATPSYDDDPGDFPGVASYDDVVEPSTYWKSYTSVDTAYLMTDGDLRSLIQYLVAFRLTACTTKDITDLCNDFFGGYVEVDDSAGDMTLTLTHDETNDPSILFKIVDFLGLLPNPAGVQVNVVEV